jgi:putative Mn2+ efflux pump MntP
VVGIAFGVAQGLMPLIGWGLGVAFQDAFQLVDHWIAFVLLGGLGIRMITASRKQQTQPLPSIAKGWQLVTLAIATSIDAAGMTIAMLDVPVAVACIIIAAITFLLSTGGVLLGRAAGSRLGSTAGIVGGFILIILGTKILIEHQFLT